ncbi:SCP2 sterol-binding domain-containing protein [Aciditerrimonas ferrireducens]|uniref:SCP2 sterol-binding domain-containing protein n=1 Tax=Aciditerrimonas ferrireducens TaxID=667306 RepID=A0ABV6C1C2_9ACTN
MEPLPRPVLGPAWLAAANQRLAGLTLPLPGPEGPLAASDGRLVVCLQATEPPASLADAEGIVAVTLRVEGGVARLEAGRAADAQVTVALPYSVAEQLAEGRTAVAQALLEGQVKVRGDLGVLLAGQQILAALGPALRPPAQTVAPPGPAGD